MTATVATYLYETGRMTLEQAADFMVTKRGYARDAAYAYLNSHEFMSCLK